jgi:ribosomal protein S18 acetylase RimI-like enzyme
VQTRPARPEDADAIVALLMRGFATYGEWEPGWSPSEELRQEQLRAWRAGLLDPDAWTLLAEDGGAVVAVVRFGPARSDHASGARVPGLAHLGALFVDPGHWGRGIGRSLLAAATDEMGARGYEGVRLLAPAGNRRARELYERHGFEPLGPWPERLFGIEVIEHRLALTEGGEASERR